MLYPRQLEKIIKGVANHRRIEILNLLDKSPELSLTDIAGRLKIDFRTAGEHVRRLYLAGMIVKRNRGAEVAHKVNALGKYVLKFLRTLE